MRFCDTKLYTSFDELYKTIFKLQGYSILWEAYFETLKLWPTKVMQRSCFRIDTLLAVISLISTMTMQDGTFFLTFLVMYKLDIRVFYLYLDTFLSAS